MQSTLELTDTIQTAMRRSRWLYGMAAFAILITMVPLIGVPGMSTHTTVTVGYMQTQLPHAGFPFIHAFLLPWCIWLLIERDHWLPIPWIWRPLAEPPALIPGFLLLVLYHHLHIRMNPTSPLIYPQARGRVSRIYSDGQTLSWFINKDPQLALNWSFQWLFIGNIIAFILIIFATIWRMRAHNTGDGRICFKCVYPLAAGNLCPECGRKIYLRGLEKSRENDSI